MARDTGRGDCRARCVVKAFLIVSAAPWLVASWMAPRELVFAVAGIVAVGVVWRVLRDAWIGELV